MLRLLTIGSKSAGIAVGDELITRYAIHVRMCTDRYQARARMKRHDHGEDGLRLRGSREDMYDGQRDKFGFFGKRYLPCLELVSSVAGNRYHFI